MLLGCITWLIGVAIAASVLVGAGDRHEGIVIYSALLVSNGIAALCFALALLSRFVFRSRLPANGFYQYKVGAVLLFFTLTLFCWLFVWMFMLH